MSINDILGIDAVLFAIRQRNLVYNYNFVNYSNKTVNTAVVYGHPDGWVYQDPGSGGMIGFDPNTNSCMINKSSGTETMVFSQAISEFPRWTTFLPGQKVSACAMIQVPGSVGAAVTFSIFDGIDTSSKTIYINAGGQTAIEIGIDVSPVATQLTASISCNTASAVLYITKVYANLGAIAVESLPCVIEGNIGERKQYVSTEVPPATDLSLCNASIELSNSYTRLNSFLNGKFGMGSNGNSLLPDMRGYFSRAWDNGAGVDPDAANRTALGSGTVTGDNVGTVEQDQFKQHTHPLQFDLSGQIPAGPSAALPSINKALTSNTGQTGGNETRGKNIAELYTIKWA